MAGSDPVTHAAPGVKLTYDGFLQFPDDGQRHELIDGEHYVTPSPNTKHQSVSLNLILVIGNWLELNPIGRLFHAPSTSCSPSSTSWSRICCISQFACC
jgi:Uma2 family endonuclease